MRFYLSWAFREIGQLAQLKCQTEVGKGDAFREMDSIDTMDYMDSMDTEEALTHPRPFPFIKGRD